MTSALAQALRQTRLAAGLTQEQLGLRLGLKARAVSRWERGDSAPTRRHRRALLTALAAVNPTLANALAVVFAGDGAGAAAPAPAPAPPADPAQLEWSILKLADELNLPPRLVRAGVANWLGRVRTANYTLEAAEQQIRAWLEQSRPNP